MLPHFILCIIVKDIMQDNIDNVPFSEEKASLKSLDFRVPPKFPRKINPQTCCEICYNENIKKHNNVVKTATNNTINTKKTENNKNFTKQKFKNNNGMSGKIKVFDQNLYDIYDKKSRVIIKDLLGDLITDNPDKYGEDMIVVSDKIPYCFIELQVYGRWTEEKFPYESPFIYERKLRFRPTTLFICFNANYDRLIMFSRESVHPKKYRVKKYSKEYIYYVPWCKALTIKTKALDIRTIRNYCGIYDTETETESKSKTYTESETSIDIDDLDDF